ncbi:uncharacterized protein LOC135841519 isoform X2 [Planococcus citri]
MKFSSEDEFWKWKEKEESSSISMFTRNKTHVKKNGDRMTRFTCNRSGVYRKKGTGQRMARSKGTCKIGFCCTARILVTFEAEGSVNVEYHSTHIGHDHQFCFLPLPSSQKQLIADKLKEGADLDQILNEVRNEITASSALEKKHFLNKKTLFNIIKKYSISEVKKKPKENEVNAETLLNECNEMAHNPIVMNKQKGESHPVLDVNQTMIIIMNDVQIEILKKFGPEKICIDCVNNPKKSNFQIIAILVIDEFGEEFPCCFCICDLINETTLSILFGVIKSYTGPISTKIFMSEDEQCYHDAWEKIMTEKPELILLCKWHVDEEWKKNLKLIGDKRAKCEVYSRLRPLLEETDSSAFFSSFSSILDDLKQAGHVDFHNYFRSKYGYRLEAWAPCYRSKEFINHNMALEAFHRVLNHLHAKGIKNTNMDVLLHLFFKVIREKVFNRLMHLEDIAGTSYKEKLYKRHRRRNEVKEIDESSCNHWQVKCDRQENVIYNVKTEAETCECKRKCTSCGVCVHMFSCTCNDYLIMHNLCKHIHAIRMLKIQPEKMEADVEESTTSDVTDRLIMEDVCQVLEVGNYMSIQGKDNLINKLNQCLSLINETECENITTEMEETMNTNVDNILAILYGNFKVTVESIY